MTRSTWRRALLGWVLLGLAGAAQAQPAKSPMPAATKKTKAAAAPSDPGASGNGWRVAPRPAWVVEPPGLVDPPAGALPPKGQAGGLARRDLLADVQTSYLPAKPQSFTRVRSQAIEVSGLGQVSQHQIRFNPAFQTVSLHDARVWRDGRAQPRMKDARIESMRREQQLEQLQINGVETLLVVLNDVRIGDVVELSYTIEGENPIYEGRIDTGLNLAWDAPLELLHYRVVAPVDRPLQVRTLGTTDVVPERLTAAASQVVRVVRSNVAAVQTESGTPPWFKVYPMLSVSEYRSWAEVDDWAKRLFAEPAAGSAAVAERAAAFRASGLSGGALVAEVLRFVQDEVRYFSVSLGESSHRPKVAERTLAERMGDCKDKVVLLNALLRELGFDVRPALVSVARNRGLAEFQPSHAQFDHVVSRLLLDGSTYYLDATLSNQGLALATRGYLPYGVALVVGEGAELQPAMEPKQALNHLHFEQRWDYSKPGKPARLTATMRARGLAAEQWRAGTAVAGEQRVTEMLAGAYARAMPGLQPAAKPSFTDDRVANTWELVQVFEHADPASYAQGAIEVDLSAVEIVDVLSGPPEGQRRLPFRLEQPRVVESRIEVIAPHLPANFKLPAPVEVTDRHFLFSMRAELNGNTLTVLRRVDRRADEVLPGNVAAYRESLLRARQQTGSRMRFALFDAQKLQPQFERALNQLRATYGDRRDTLSTLLVRNELDRLFASEALAALSDARSPLAARVLVARAEANNLLGDFAAGLRDGDAALAINESSVGAREARAVALVGLGRLNEGRASFDLLLATDRRQMANHWLGAIHLLQGRASEAEQRLREVVDGGGGEEREFALLWLYLAAERQGAGRGRSAIAPHLSSVDASKLTGALLNYLDGKLERSALIKLARERGDMERLNLAETYFFIGQQLLAQGKRDEALPWLKRTVETQAVPYREVTFARLELQSER